LNFVTIEAYGGIAMALFDQQINKETRIPLYFQLKELIIKEIKNGSYIKDSMIPTEKEISEVFAISRTTVRQAISELVQEGWLYRVKSKGTFVSHPKLKQDFIQHLESYNDQIRRSGMVPSTEVIALKVMKATSIVAQNLDIKESDKVVYLFRQRFADDEPIVTIKTYLPYDVCEFVLQHDLRNEALYEILKKTDITEIKYVDRLVEATIATKTDEQYLNVKPGSPIQLITSIGYNAYKRPIEYSIARYRGDRNSFRVTVFPPPNH